MAESLEGIQISENIVPDVTKIYIDVLFKSVSHPYEIQCYLKEFCFSKGGEAKINWNLSHPMPYITVLSSNITLLKTTEMLDDQIHTLGVSVSKVTYSKYSAQLVNSRRPGECRYSHLMDNYLTRDSRQCAPTHLRVLIPAEHIFKQRSHLAHLPS